MKSLIVAFSWMLMCNVANAQRTLEGGMSTFCVGRQCDHILIESGSTPPTPKQIKAIPAQVRPLISDGFISAGAERLPDCDPLKEPLKKGWTCNVIIGDHAGWSLTDGKFNTILGACAGVLLEDGNHNTLMGDHTSTPTPHTSDFVNIGNALCFWQTTGERVACPPPVECPKVDH